MSSKRSERADADPDAGGAPASEPSDDSGSTDGVATVSGRWVGYALALLFAVVFLVAMARPYYPIATVLVIGSVLLAFGLAVGALAVRERLGGE